MSGQAFDVSCCDGTVPGAGTPGTFRQARLVSDSSLANVWLPAEFIPTGPEPFYFYNPDDGECYKVDFADAASTSPGDVIDGWETITGLNSARLCSSGGTVYYQARQCVAGYSATGNANGTLVALNGGASIPAGTYDLLYVNGAQRGDTDDHPTLWGVGVPAGGSSTIGYWLRNASNTKVLKCPGLPGTWSSQAATESANAGQKQSGWSWSGGVLKLKFDDTDYSDNANGSPSPTFRLQSSAAGTLVDKWVSGITLPYYFSHGGGNYYIDATCPTSFTPGTDVTGAVTPATGCP